MSAVVFAENWHFWVFCINKIGLDPSQNTFYAIKLDNIFKNGRTKKNCWISFAL